MSVGIYDVFFFFKQKTAYEMRISDWSSDVCSSDLYDTRMVRVQRQGKTSFYMKSTGEEAVAVAAALALDNADMCFPTYRQQGLLIARDWPLTDMMNQVYSNSGDRLKEIGSASCRESGCKSV